MAAKGIRRELQWFDECDGRWIARAVRSCGGRYLITMREFEDGRVFDVQRLKRTGPNAWQPSYIGSGTTLGRAQALARANHDARLTTHRRSA